MSQNLQIATLEEYRKLLSQPDAVLEQSIYNDAIVGYLDGGGAPMDAVTLLSESYIGLPSMCNVTAQSVNNIINCDIILRKAIREQLTKRFDPKRCDDFFMYTDNQPAPGWLTVIIKDTHWRQTLYELLSMYPNCAFLNFSIQKIAEAGYKDEVSKLRTTSTYLEVYNIILSDSLSEILSYDDIQFEDSLSSLMRVCCEREDTYLYSQILLRRLSEEIGPAPFRRLRRELERVANEKGNRHFVNLLHSHLTGIPPGLSRTLSNISNTNSITPGDLITLVNLYKSNNPPAADFLCDYDVIVKFLKALYVPQEGFVLRHNMLDDLTFLIAYATSVNDANPRQDNKIQNVQDTLRSLHECLAKKTELGSIAGAMKYILAAVRIPVGSMGVLLWIEYMAIHTSYFESYFRTTETSPLHLILDEIAHRHPLQQPIVFDIIKRCIRHKYPSFAPELQMALEKAWVDRMLYLVQNNYTIPVLKYFKGPGRELDDSLILHFVKKVFRMAEPPYSKEFTELILDIVEVDMDSLTLIRDVRQLVYDFCNIALENGSVLDHLDKLRLMHVMNRCK